ncbi:MAG TPA: DUF5984 family protein [Streptosporangiaceae bacterium]|nr:DUF5984 family protein [Streptosporangiaceae bacterium]
MIRFRFGLTPLARVLPWGGQEPGQEPRLHWFGLTDGWYWIELGDGRELLRYSPRTVARLRQGPGAVVSHPYVDYYVARFWEDLALLTPAVTQPVPAGLLPFLVSGHDDWPPQDGWSEAAWTAAIWHDEHSLNLGYLRPAPRVRAWRTEAAGCDLVTLTWRQPAEGEDEKELSFADPAGTVTSPAGAFQDAVRRLDRELLAAMGERVAELERDGPPAGVRVDLDQLRAEHEDRKTWLARRADRIPDTDWPAVRAGAAELLAGPGTGVRRPP